MDLAESVALVTGGSGAVGQAVVEELARSGADVTVGYHTDEAGAEAAVEAARAHGVDARAVQADLTDEDDAERLVADAAEQGDLRALVTAAGVTDPGPLADLDAERLERLLAVNVGGTVAVTRAASERMRTGAGGPGGAIVAVSSVAAEMGTVDAGYAAAKGGVDGFVRAVARELGAEGVRANVVAPGPVETPMNDDVVASLEARRFRGHGTVDTLLDRYEATPGEVAAAARFLLSHGFVTGEVLHVDGGMSL
ncbi:MAG: SDR family NAD(P)-dependent oxidoreductase [Haloarculaceae archaeon]